MVSNSVKEMAVSLANELKETTEYKDMKEKEEAFNNDAEAQNMVEEFKQKQQELMRKRMSGEDDPDLTKELIDLQGKLNQHETLISFADSYSRFVQALSEVGNTLSEELNFDFGEVYRQQHGGSCGC